MKKLTAITTLSLALIAQSNHSLAATTASDAKQGAAFATTTVIGTVIGGPVGFVVGALAGAYLGEEIKQADETSTSLHQAEAEITALEDELSMNQTLLVEQIQTQEPHQLQLESLPMRVFFSTNSDELNADASAVMDAIAEVLINNPSVSIELTGHTDPRGNDDYNNVLSQYRAKAVEKKLIEMGIGGDRIDTRGEGENYSQAPKGDGEAYALERRVDIDLLTDKNNNFVSRF